MLSGGDPPGALTRPGATLWPSNSCAGPRSAFRLVFRVYPCYLILLEDCQFVNSEWFCQLVCILLI
jgi:hypothetical protein